MVRNRSQVNTCHRSAQIITGQLCIFIKNWRRTCALVTKDERHPSMRSWDQLKTKYLLFCKTYCQQTSQGSNLWWREFIHVVTWLSDNVVTWGHVANRKFNIFYSTKPVTAKLSRAVTYDEGKSLMMSHDVLTKSSIEVKGQIENLVSALPQALWSPNFAGESLMMKETHSWCHLTLWPRSRMRSRDKLKTKHLLFYKACDHQTC